MAKAPVSPSASFEPAPAGTQQAVCCDIIDLGILTWSYQGQQQSGHKVRLRWQVAAKGKDGHRLIVQKQYTWSMHVKATLRKDVSSWRGKPFTDAEAADFDFDRLLGANCYINVMHAVKNGTLYADVAAIMPVPKGLPKLTVENYVRQKDRPPEPAAAATPAGAPPATAAPPPEEFDDPFGGARETKADVSEAFEPPSDDDIPF